MTNVEKLLAELREYACQVDDGIVDDIVSRIAEAVEADRARPEGAVRVTVVDAGTYETDGEWFASWTIISDDETRDEIDDLPIEAWMIPVTEGSETP